MTKQNFIKQQINLSDNQLYNWKNQLVIQVRSQMIDSIWYRIEVQIWIGVHQRVRRIACYLIEDSIE